MHLSDTIRIILSSPLSVLGHFPALEGNCIAGIPSVCPTVVSLQLSSKQSASSLSLCNRAFPSPSICNYMSSDQLTAPWSLKTCQTTFQSSLFIRSGFIDSIDEWDSAVFIFLCLAVSLEMMFCRFIHIVTIDRIYFQTWIALIFVCYISLSICLLMDSYVYYAVKELQ